MDDDGVLGTSNIENFMGIGLKSNFSNPEFVANRELYVKLLNYLKDEAARQNTYTSYTIPTKDDPMTIEAQFYAHQQIVETLTSVANYIESEVDRYQREKGIINGNFNQIMAERTADE